MDLKSRKVVVTVASAALGLVIMTTSIFCGKAARTTDKNSTVDKKNYLAVATTEDEIASIAPRKEILVGAANKEEETTTQPETEAPTEAPTQAPVSPYENKFMVNVNEYLNIRSEANENSDIAGKLYAGAGGDVIQKGDQWTQISSGSVTGYVSNEFIVTGAAAEAKANEVGKKIATVTGESIRVRETADPNGKVFGLAAQNDQYECLSQADGWVQINYEDGPAYIAAEFVNVELKVDCAISKEEEQAKLAAEAKAEQKTVQEKQFEEQVNQNESVQKEAEQRDSYNVSYDDAYLLACLVYSEAGSEPYEGKLATANIVLNRLSSGRYGSSISDVINAPGQFSVVRLGTFAAALSSGPNSESVRAANDALAGNNNVPGYNSFCNAAGGNYDSYGSYSVIGNQVFY